MKINELKTGTAEDIVVKVVELSEPRQVTTKFGTQITLTNAVVEDDTGKIKLSLWGKDGDNVKEGSTLKIDKAFVKEFRGELQLTKGKGGKIEIVE